MAARQDGQPSDLYKVRRHDHNHNTQQGPDGQVLLLSLLDPETTGGAR